jgi:NAD(P)-dependent dehydrogenase (short-subunit alcohol dehydrogenase family)
MIDLGLTGKRVIVSGAGYIPERAGHGRGSALRLAEAGAAVACIDIDRGRAEDTVAEIRAAGGVAHPIVADMTIRAEADRAVATAVELLGGLDVGVDIIGRALYDKVEDITDEHWDWTMLNNLTQVFYFLQIAGRHMKQQGTGGSLVAIASVDGIFAASTHAPYGAAKAGVISLIRTFADELGAAGIRVNAVAPGNVGSGNEDQVEGVYADNDINPLAAPRTRDIANGVLFLASELAARITGHTLVVDGGATIHSLWDLTGPPPG